VGVVLVSVMQPLDEQFAGLSWLKMHVRSVYQAGNMHIEMNIFGKYSEYNPKLIKHLKEHCIPRKTSSL